MVSSGPRSSVSFTARAANTGPEPDVGVTVNAKVGAVLTVARSTTTWLPPGTRTSLGVPVAGGSGASRTVASASGAVSSSELVRPSPCRASGTTPGVVDSSGRPAAV